MSPDFIMRVLHFATPGKESPCESPIAYTH